MSVFATKPVRSLLAPALAVGLVLLAAGSVDALLHERVTGGPSVGSLLAFQAGAPIGYSNPTLSVTRADGQPCVLDIPTIRAGGGSFLVLERVRTDTLNFRVLWTGPRSAEGRDSCGASAELWLDKREVTALLYAAGGYGPTGGR